VIIISDGSLAVDAAGNHRSGAIGAQFVAQGIGIIALVGDQAFERPGGGDKIARDMNIADVSGREPDDGWTAQQIGDYVDFRGLPTTGGADSLRFRPPYGWPAPPADIYVGCRCSEKEGTDHEHSDPRHRPGQEQL